MSNLILDDLLTFLAGQGLTMQVLAGASHPNLRLIQGPDNRPLSALHRKTLIEGIRSYRSEQLLKSLTTNRKSAKMPRSTNIIANPNKVPKEGKLKSCKIIHSSYPNRGSEEECRILVHKEYKGSDLNSLMECAPCGFIMSELSTTISISAEAVARGSMRIAYRALLGYCPEYNRGAYCFFPGDGFIKYDFSSILKESCFFGGDDNLNRMKDQAHIQAVASVFAEIFNEVVKKRGIQARRIIYLPVSVVTIPGRPYQPYYTLEPRIEGKYIKFDKTVILNEFQEEMYLILQTFSHFTYCYSEGRALVTDIQGVVENDKYILTDPTIHTAKPKKILKDPSNLGAAGMSAFFKAHVCNDICRNLSLKLPRELYSSP